MADKTQDKGWFADVGGRENDVIILDQDDEYICEIQRFTADEDLAPRARLIAAAPKLLAKLEELANLMGKHDCDDQDMKGQVAHDEDFSRCCAPEEPMGCSICEARALILAANGEEVDTDG